MKELLSLFLTFAKIGAFMFGGGYAMLPLLEKELIERKGWVTREEILDYFAISQCTPGVIAVNTATFVGHKRKGVAGGVFATLGVIFVPMLLIILIAALLQSFWSTPIVRRIFSGIRISVAALIITAVIKLIRSSVRKSENGRFAFPFRSTQKVRYCSQRYAMAAPRVPVRETATERFTAVFTAPFTTGIREISWVESVLPQ